MKWIFLSALFIVVPLLAHRAAVDMAQARALLIGLGAGVLTQAGLALEQRYLDGEG